MKYMTMTKDKEAIAAGNKKIAEFMGMPRHACGRPDCYRFGVVVDYTPAEMHYHKSWDWLMDSVERCNQICLETGYPDNLELPHLRIICTNIGDVYNRVIEFIDWYTTQSPKP